MTALFMQEHDEPTRNWLLIDIDEPIDMNVRTERDLPKRPVDLMLKLEAISTLCSTESFITEPTFCKPMTERPLPKRAQARSDIELPAVAKSSTLSELPILQKARKLYEDPNAIISATDNFDSICTPFLLAVMDTVLPSLAMLRQERPLPNWTKSNTLIALETRQNARILKVDPSDEAFNTDMSAPK